MKKKRRINLGTKWNIFIKANTSAGAGLPISFLLNISILPLFAPMFISDNPLQIVLASLMVSVPFYWASVARMFTIDLAYVKYQIDISPTTLFRNLYNKLKR